MCKESFSRIIVVCAIVFLCSCSSYQNHISPMEKQIPEANLVHGLKATEYRQNEMIGAGIGALGKSLVMGYQDRLESELRSKINGSSIVIQREGHRIRLLFPDADIFDPTSATLRSDYYPALDALADILKDYRQTMIEVIGYCDHAHSDQQRLPEQRAFEISSYLVAQELHHERFESVGLKRSAPMQVEIRLLPLQRTVSMSRPRQNAQGQFNPKGFVAL